MPRNLVTYERNLNGVPVRYKSYRFLKHTKNWKVFLFNCCCYSCDLNAKKNNINTDNSNYNCNSSNNKNYNMSTTEETKDVDMTDTIPTVDGGAPMEESITKLPATTTNTNAPPRFEIKKWNAVAMWSWDICADTCAICRNSLNEPSIEYQANPAPTNDNGLSIAFGNCGHVFHLDCIQRWLKTRSVCPLCNKEWDFAKIERIPGYGQVSLSK